MVTDHRSGLVIEDSFYGLQLGREGAGGGQRAFTIGDTFARGFVGYGELEDYGGVDSSYTFLEDIIGNQGYILPFGNYSSEYSILEEEQGIASEESIPGRGFPFEVPFSDTSISRFEISIPKFEDTGNGTVFEGDLSDDGYFSSDEAEQALKELVDEDLAFLYRVEDFLKEDGSKGEEDPFGEIPDPSEVGQVRLRKLSQEEIEARKACKGTSSEVPVPVDEIPDPGEMKQLRLRRLSQEEVSDRKGEGESVHEGSVWEVPDPSEGSESGDEQVKAEVREQVEEKTSASIDKRKRYEELRGCSAEEAFSSFVKHWGVWLSARAGSLAYLKGLEKSDVEQYLLMQAWRAAQDPRFDEEMEEGKTIIGWIRQRVVWYMRNILRQKNGGLKSIEGELLEDYRYEESEREPVDSVSGSQEGVEVDPYIMMSASLGLTQSHRRREAAELLDRAYEEAKTLSPRYGYAIMEIIRPSKHFRMFMSMRGGYGGAASFETCGIKEVIDYIRSLGIRMSRIDLERGIEILKVRIPELDDVHELDF